MSGFDYAIDPPGNYDEPEVELPDEPRLSPTDAMLNALEERIYERGNTFVFAQGRLWK